MGRGDSVVGNPKPKPNQSTVNDQAKDVGGPRPSKPRQQQMCGAMNEQRSDHGGYSQPQGFVRLVGHRDPKVRPPRAPG
jgi:hypothetical protein